MTKANGFLAVRIAVAAACVFISLLWVAAQYAGDGDGRGAAVSGGGGDYRLMWPFHVAVSGTPSWFGVPATRMENRQRTATC